jgi:two-component system, OmpR family, copper resistance phosphate regulon response regulator CusR
MAQDLRILVVEDETKTAAFIEKGLREVGYEVVVARDGETGLEEAVARPYHLLILDVMLPKRDGWSVISELRNRKVETPVLFLTARDGVRDRVKGFGLGADDYLAKPFAFAELLARVRVLLRRHLPTNQLVLRVDDLEIDTRRHRAKRAGTPLRLTSLEFRVLVELARADGGVVSRATLSEEVWGVKMTGATNVIDVMMRRLRAIVDDPCERKLIQTIRGVGYALHPSSSLTTERVFE